MSIARRHLIGNLPHVSSAPILSIVIVAYKSCAEIAGCLGSLPRTLLGGSVKVVVVDNSAGDGTGEIVRERFPWVKYIAPEKNLGFGRANNLGYSQSNPGSEFVLFLNPDTVCNEAALVHCVRRLRADETIGLISPKLVLVDGTMDLACRRSIPSLWDGFCRASGLAAKFPRRPLLAGYNLTHLPEDGTYDVGAINGAFMLGRRGVFQAVAATAAKTPRVEDERLTFKGVAEDELKAESLKLKAQQGTAGDENPELRAESTEESERKAYSSKPKAEHRELKADSLPLTAYSLPLEASSARYTRVFDDSFFMYGDDLDLCIRVAKAGWRIVYDGSVSITHLKGVSVAKDYGAMSQAIFDANRDVYLKHFNPRRAQWVRWKYVLAFGAWKIVGRILAKVRGHRRVRPL